jgi:hypothetical protein
MSAHTPDAWAEAEATKIVGIVQDLSVSAADAEAILKTTLLIAYHKGAAAAFGKCAEGMKEPLSKTPEWDNAENRCT